MISSYKHVYALRNRTTGYWILGYNPNTATRKALFSSRKRAEAALMENPLRLSAQNIEIVEL